MIQHERRRKLEEYLAKIAVTAMEAEQLRARVDEPYREILDKEIEGYHELIKLWRSRLDQMTEASSREDRQ